MAPRVIRRKVTTVVTTVETFEEYIDSSEEDHHQDTIPNNLGREPMTQIVPFAPLASTLQRRNLEPAEEHHEVIEASLEQSSTINCVLCSFSSTNEPELENHIEENHKEIFNVVKNEVPTESALTEKENLNCVLCTFTSTNEAELENHIDESHKDIFSEVQPESDLTGQTFNCVLCTFSSTNEPELENHIDDKHKDIFKASTTLKRRHDSDDSESDLSDPSDLDSDISISWSSSSDSETEKNLTTVRKRCRTEKKKSERLTHSKELLSDDDEDIIEVGRVQRVLPMPPHIERMICRKGCDSPYCPLHKK